MKTGIKNIVKIMCHRDNSERKDINYLLGLFYELAPLVDSDKKRLSWSSIVDTYINLNNFHNDKKRKVESVLDNTIDFSVGPSTKKLTFN